MAKKKYQSKNVFASRVKATTTGGVVTYTINGRNKKIKYSYSEDVIKRDISRTNKNKSDIYKDVQRNVRETNRRLEQLMRGYDKNKAVRNPKTGRFERKGEIKHVSFDTGTWASKGLLNRLESAPVNVIKNGKIILPKNLNITQLTAIQRATDSFLRSQTSKISGIRKNKQKTIDTIKEKLNNPDEDFDMSDDDAEFFYQMFDEDSDSAINFLVEKIGWSETWVNINDSIKEKDTSEEWWNRINNYLHSNDDNIRIKMQQVYVQYINPYI